MTPTVHANSERRLSDRRLGRAGEPLEGGYVGHNTTHGEQTTHHRAVITTVPLTRRKPVTEARVFKIGQDDAAGGDAGSGQWMGAVELAEIETK